MNKYIVICFVFVCMLIIVLMLLRKKDVHNFNSRIKVVRIEGVIYSLTIGIDEVAGKLNSICILLLPTTKDSKFIETCVYHSSSDDSYGFDTKSFPIVIHLKDDTSIVVKKNYCYYVPPTDNVLFSECASNLMISKEEIFDIFINNKQEQFNNLAVRVQQMFQAAK